MLFDVIKAAILGIVEGLTEYLPVSSTGHLLLVEHFFGFADEDFGKTFAVLIQLGAILALLSIYFTRLWQLALGFFTDATSRRFVIGVLVAFLPAAVIGAIAHDFIKNVLFNPWIVCFMLIAGGAVLLWIDASRPQAEVSRRDHVLAADLSGYRHCPVRGDGPGRLALRRYHRRRDVDGGGSANGGGILVLARDADHGRRVRLRSLQERSAPYPGAT